MKYVNIGNFNVSVIGFGTHLVGGRHEPDYSQDELYVELIKKALSLGVNHIDTAEIYGAGHSEEIVGRAINSFNRENLFIASKVWSTNLRKNDLMSSIKEILKRLDTNYLDLCYIHYPNPDISLKETMESLEEVKDLGLIKNIGVSNFSIDLIKEANSYLKKCEIVAVQSEYSLLNKNNKDLVKFCQDQGIVFVAYKPLGKGLVLSSSNNILDEFAVKYKRTKAEIALNWLMSQKNVIVIPKTSSLDHLLENIASCNFTIENSDLDLLSDY